MAIRTKTELEFTRAILELHQANTYLAIALQAVAPHIPETDRDIIISAIGKHDAHMRTLTDILNRLVGSAEDDEQR